MGIPVMIMGESGSGKSYSIRNMNPETVGVFNVSSKFLPFKGAARFKQVKGANANYAMIEKTIMRGKLKRYVIDDSQYLMAFESFSKVNEVGYGKFTNMAVNFYNLVQAAIAAPDDVITYFLHHVEQNDMGKIKAKTLGKMLDNQLTLEGLFGIVLLCKADGTRHYFETQSDGYTTAKSPAEMFDVTIDNDLQMVDEKIREYYEMEAVQ